jgi:hypothetical protein
MQRSSPPLTDTKLGLIGRDLIGPVRNSGRTPTAGPSIELDRSIDVR